MEPDIAIARKAKLRNVPDIAEEMGIPGEAIVPWGNHKTKADITKCDLRKPAGKVILVTAMSPTPFGEGKTTTSIGLAMALNKKGRTAVVGLREPSMGPMFGIKGGAAGGGYSQVLPMEDINLHFTGDNHAITTAHNLLSAIINNSMSHRNPMRIDSRKILWPRVMDMNDRSLRQVVVGLGTKRGGMVDEDRFDITAASEVMAVICLTDGYEDLKKRLERMLVAFTTDHEPLYAKDFDVTGAMSVVLKDTLNPNLVQTIEGTPAIIHGGPFGNIAHGTSSYLGSLVGRKYADFYVTEAGFGSDLGAEKFFDIFCRETGTKVAAVVIVATVRALKYHGGVKKKHLKEEDYEALVKGFSNLRRHVENVIAFGYKPVVALNITPWDKEKELDIVEEMCDNIGVRFVRSTVYARGSEGGSDLADAVLETAEEKEPSYAYPLDISLKEKIETLAKKVYGAGTVVYTPDANRSIKRWEKLGHSKLPVCMAKTQYSFSDDPKAKGAAEGFEFQIRDVRLSAGAGFVVPISGEINTMPGLPKRPAAEQIDIDEDLNIVGLS